MLSLNLNTQLFPLKKKEKAFIRMTTAFQEYCDHLAQIFHHNKLNLKHERKIIRENIVKNDLTTWFPFNYQEDISIDCLFFDKLESFLYLNIDTFRKFTIQHGYDLNYLKKVTDDSIKEAYIEFYKYLIDISLFAKEHDTLGKLISLNSLRCICKKFIETLSISDIDYQVKFKSNEDHHFQYIDSVLKARFFNFNKNELNNICQEITPFRKSSNKKISKLADSIFWKAYRYMGPMCPPEVPLVSYLTKGKAKEVAELLYAHVLIDDNQKHKLESFLLNQISINHKKNNYPFNENPFYCSPFQIRSKKIGRLCFILKELENNNLINSNNLWKSIEKHKLFYYKSSNTIKPVTASKLSSYYSDFMYTNRKIINNNLPNSSSSQTHNFIQSTNLILKKPIPKPHNRCN